MNSIISSKIQDSTYHTSNTQTLPITVGDLPNYNLILVYLKLTKVFNSKYIKDNDNTYLNEYTSNNKL